MKKTIVYTALFAAMLVICNNNVYAQKKAKPAQTLKTNDDNDIKTFHVEGDPLDGTKNAIFIYKDGKNYVIKTEKEKIIALSIDGIKMPESAFSEYELTVKKIMAQLKQDRAQAEKDSIQAEKDMKLGEQDLVQAEQDKIQAEKDMVRAELDKQLAEEQEILAIKSKEEVVQNKRLMEQDKKQAAADYQQAVIDKKQAMRDKIQADADAKQALLDKKQSEDDKVTLQSIIKDLVAAKVITNEKELRSLYLTKGVLIVNDQKQSDQLHEQLKTQYLRSRNRQINYSRENGSSRFSSITVDDK
jgi:colicin import membrane protein